MVTTVRFGQQILANSVRVTIKGKTKVYLSDYDGFVPCYLFTDALKAEAVSQPCCVLCTALLCSGSARGGHFSKGLTGYNIGHVQQFLKDTCSVY
jgi:hypothetical protein